MGTFQMLVLLLTISAGCMAATSNVSSTTSPSPSTSTAEGFQVATTSVVMVTTSVIPASASGSTITPTPTVGASSTLNAVNATPVIPTSPANTTTTPPDLTTTTPGTPAPILRLWQIAAIAVGGFVFILLVVVIIVCCCCMRRSKTKKGDEVDCEENQMVAVENGKAPEVNAENKGFVEEDCGKDDKVEEKKDENKPPETNGAAKANESPQDGQDSAL